MSFFDLATIPEFGKVVGKDDQLSPIPEAINEFWSPGDFLTVRRNICLYEAEIEGNDQLLEGLYTAVHQGFSKVHVGAMREVCAHLNIPFPQVDVNEKECEMMTAARRRGQEAAEKILLSSDRKYLVRHWIASMASTLKDITDVISKMIPYLARDYAHPLHAARARAIYAVLLLEAEAERSCLEAFKYAVRDV